MSKRWICVAILLLSSAAVAVVCRGSSWRYALAAAVETPAVPLGNSKSAEAVKPERALAGATVTISNFQFTPKVIRIKVGGSVTWEVKEGTHSVNADDGSFESTLSAGQKFSHQFARPGTYRYYCSFHGSKGGHDMAGTVIVSR